MRFDSERLVHAALRRCARAYPRKAALVSGGQTYTYGELEASSSRLAGALQERGLARGDRVAIQMESTWECAVSIYGAIKAGGVFVLIHPQTRVDKVAFMIGDCGARLALVDAGLAAADARNLSGLTHVLVRGRRPDAAEPTDSPSPVVEDFDEAIGASAAEYRDPGTIETDLCALIYTSGSTGATKGVMQTHQAMSFAADSIIAYLQLEPTDIILNVLPMSFDYGLYQLLMTVRTGATVVLERSFTYPGRMFQRIEECGVTVFPGVPTMFSMILAAHRRKPLCFPAMRIVTNTADALPAEFVPPLQEVFPNARIFKMYGLTECKRVSYLPPERIGDKPGSVGRAIPGTEVFLLSPEGEPVEQGERGILHVRGPHVMCGYWNRPEDSARALREGDVPGDRILCTGDWFTMDAEGDLYFIGRSDDMIKVQGEKVAPVEVERALYAIAGVREAAVVGMEDELLGHAVRAYVVLDESSSLDARRIRKELAERLEGFMIPREIVFRASLPRTQTGKISRRELK